MTFIRSAITILGFAGGASAILTLMGAFYLSAQHGFRITMTTNSIGEFWVESALLIITFAAFLWSYFGLFRELARH